jgi:hypothetical protein
MSTEPFSGSLTEQAQKKADDTAQLVRAYKRLFAREDGQRVLADLQTRYGWHKPTATTGTSTDEIVRRECMKHPLYHIQAMLDFQFRKPAKPKKAASNTSPT